MPIRASRCGGWPVTSLSLNNTRPESGFNTPVIRLNNVVFPAPFGPTTDRTSPARTVKSTPSTATRPPNRFVRCATVSIASDDGVSAASRDSRRNDRRIQIFAMWRIVEFDVRSKRRDEIESRQRFPQCAAIDLAGLLQSGDERADRVSAIAAINRCLRIEFLLVRVEKDFQRWGRRLQIRREPAKRVHQPAFAPIPVDRIEERTDPGNQRFVDPRVADLADDLHPVTERRGDEDRIWLRAAQDRHLRGGILLAGTERLAGDTL